MYVRVSVVSGGFTGLSPRKTTGVVSGLTEGVYFCELKQTAIAFQSVSTPVIYTLIHLNPKVRNWQVELTNYWSAVYNKVVCQHFSSFQEDSATHVTLITPHD